MSGTLVARTTRLDADVDLLDVAGAGGVLFEQDGCGLAGRGVALRTPVAEGTDALEAIEVEDEVEVPGTGPVAFGALPFDRDAPAELIVPAVVVGRAPDGTRWVTRIGDAATVATEAMAPDPPRREGGEGGPSSFAVTPSRSPASWCVAVAQARDAVRAGRLAKVVLAREVVVEADAAIPVAPLLARLRAAYRSSITFAVDGFVGATPELLVSRTGDVVRSQPMAGTTPRTGDPAADARLASHLLASAKDRQEHQITIDMVHDTLLPWCSYLDALAEPTVVAAGSVQHLATLVEGRLSSPAPSVLTLALALHPTPAVCGSPREEALALIGELEELDRGRYAGPVGWVDARGNGRWAVGLRCAEIDGHRARVPAGVGVVADSDPDAELAETRAKLQAMLSALIRP